MSGFSLSLPEAGSSLYAESDSWGGGWFSHWIFLPKVGKKSIPDKARYFVPDKARYFVGGADPKRREFQET